MKPPYQIRRVETDPGEYRWEVLRWVSDRHPYFGDILGPFLSWQIAMTAVAQDIKKIARELRLRRGGK